jgi:hypothetical protein
MGVRWKGMWWSRVTLWKGMWCLRVTLMGVRRFGVWLVLGVRWFMVTLGA